VRDDALLLTGADGARRWHGVLSDITETRRAQVELDCRAAQQAAVARLGEHALKGASTSDLMQEAVRAAAGLLEVDSAGVLELLPEEDEFAVRAGYPVSKRTLGARGPAGRASQAGYTLVSSGPVTVTDTEEEKRFASSPNALLVGMRSGLSVAIEGRQSPFGVLGLQSTSVREFTDGDVDFALAIANVLGDAVERQLADDDSRHRALHDPLTGLPNRILFMDRLEQAIERLRRRRSPTAIMVLDLDRFQLVNDSLGHQIGDECDQFLLLAAFAT
jgi:GAF domain-containing protein